MEVLVSAVVAVVVAIITSVAALYLQTERLKQELKTEFMAEQAIADLLNHPDWKLRSWKILSSRIGGFDEEELRQMLVRAGALRFWSHENGQDLEWWGLRTRNEDRLNLRENPPAGTD